MRYDLFLVDVVNFAYKTFFLKSTENCTPEQVGKHRIYKEYACSFIRSLENLEKEYLTSDGRVILLFDNYFSRADLQSAFNFADRKKLDEAYKATRKKENRQFYNTINFIRYYYMIGSNNHFTVRLDDLEADDLVKPALDSFKLENQKCLLISSDLDWCRYLSEDTDWLPSLKDFPKNRFQVSEDLGFNVTETSLITYKAVFGDISDNIQALATSKYKPQFLDIVSSIKFPEQLIIFGRDEKLREKYSFLNFINANEHQYRINVQLISAIPCSQDIFKKAIIQGRNEKALFEAVQEAIELVNTKTFVFGNIRRPRA